MKESTTLDFLHPGQTATVTSMSATEGMGRRLLDIGLIEGTSVKCLGRSPSGDPTAFLIRGAVIALRHSDCETIGITHVEEVMHHES